MDPNSQNPYNSKRPRGTTSTQPESPTPVTPPSQPFNMNQWAGFTPSELQNNLWSNQNPTPFGVNPTNLFSNPTIFENVPDMSQFTSPYPPFDQPIRPHAIRPQPMFPFSNPNQFSQRSQEGSSTYSQPESSTQPESSSQPESSTHTTDTQPDPTQPLPPNNTDIWMTEPEMLKVISRKNSSVAWPHYILTTDKKKAKCRYCNTIYTAKSQNGTGHLIRHITKKCTAMPQAGQSTMDDFLTKPNAPEQYKYDYDECSAELSKMIIQTEEPFLLAERNAFNRYVKKNQPEHKPTGRRRVRSNAMQQYCTLKHKLIADFENMSCKFNLTADVWDSGVDYHYLCITAHWVDREWNLQKRIISFSKLEFPHNAINMHNIIMASINEYNIKSKILTVTFDNATSMTAVANMLKNSLESVLLNGDLLHVRCACHVLNLCVRDGLEGLKQYHSTFKHVVLHLNSNKSRRQEWRNYCKSVGVKYRKFPMENNTRWNSMYIMLSACIEYKQPLTAFWNGIFPDSPILENHWNNMEMYVDFLCAFMDATKSFSHVYKTTAPYFLGNIIPIAELFQKYRAQQSYLGFLPKMEEKFLKYWTDIPYVYVFAVILDPRWKFDGAISLVTIYKQLMNIDFDPDLYKDEIRQAFFNVYNHYESRIGPSTRPPSRAGSSGAGGSRAFAGATLNKLKGLVSQLRPDVAQSTSTTSDLAEYHMYINYDYLRSFTDEEANVLDLLLWWKGQRRQLPVMSAMAQDFLSIQVSSVASERAFSASKRVLDEKRTSLRSDTLEMCVCYKDWMDAEERTQGMENEEDENSDDETSTESNA
uniref:Putative transposase n=1 Tax=Dianthus caryophyllus TaxID=3570 RepID=M5A9A6_DIACA|nr:putative transposase [Dianthus caryophyllus]